MSTIQIYVSLIVCLSLTVIYAEPYWINILDRHARHVGNVRLTQLNNNMATRTRRSASDFPSHMTFKFNTGTDDIIMNLEKNDYIDALPPLYLVRNGRIVREQSQLEKPNFSFYQDKATGAAVMVQRMSRTDKMELIGSYFHNGEEFSIQPIRGGSSDDVDHRISKLFHEADLQHDIIDFGSDILYAATFDGNDTSSEEILSPANTTASNEIDEIVDVSDSGNETSDGNSTSYNSTNSKSNTNNNNGSKNNNDNKNNSNIDDIRFHSPRTTTVTITEAITKSYRDGWLKQLSKDGSTESDTGNYSGSDDKEKIDSSEKRRLQRQKRQAPSYIVELLIVIDYGVFEVWRDGVTGIEGEERRAEAIKRIKQFYSFVLNGVDLRYKSVQNLADFTIDVTWAGIIVFDEENPDYWKDTEKPPQKPRDFMESSDALEAFRAWAQAQGAELPTSDHVMLFTGHNLTYGGSVSNAGLAYLGSACSPDYYFSIVEEYFEFRDVAIAAHELGHSLGARHDMDGNTCLSFNRYIMTPRFKFPTPRKAKNPWLFSQCSVDYFVEFIDGLDKNGTNCFITKDSATDQKEIQPFLVSLPGEMYAGDELCRIGNTAESYICRDKHTDGYSNICYKGISCYIPTEKTCAPQLPPDGFSCGNRKWCLNGTCTSSEVAPATQGDDCPFGDDPGLIGGKTCADRMLTSRFDCYKEVFRAKCCASCKRYRRNLPGCEYGDFFELCKKDQCINYEEDYARENCCDTCAELLFTIPSTIATTTTTPATTTLLARPGGQNGGDKLPGSKTNGTSQGGSDRDGGNGNKVVKPGIGGGGNTGREGGEGGEDGIGDDEENNRNKRRRRIYRRRNDINSDDSDDSEETNRRWYRPGRYGPNRRNYYWTNERMVQIHSLLDGMRESRDYTRLQRLRMLIYILDKTRNDDLADLILGFNGAEHRPREAGFRLREAGLTSREAGLRTRGVGLGFRGWAGEEREGGDMRDLRDRRRGLIGERRNELEIQDRLRRIEGEEGYSAERRGGDEKMNDSEDDRKSEDRDREGNIRLRGSEEEKSNSGSNESM